MTFKCVAVIVSFFFINVFVDNSHLRDTTRGGWHNPWQNSWRNSWHDSWRVTQTIVFLSLHYFPRVWNLLITFDRRKPNDWKMANSMLCRSAMTRPTNVVAGKKLASLICVSFSCTELVFLLTFSPTGPSTSSSTSVLNEMQYLENLCEKGLLPKNKFAEMLQSLLTKKTVSTMSSTTTVKPATSSMVRDVAECALSGKTKFRESKSPETLMIRSLVEFPMLRRFRLTSADEDSPLWSKVPPRRLNKPLFQRACRSPLQGILSRHVEALKQVPAEKVLHVCKWKLRKERANNKGKDMSKFADLDDGFDFEKHARLIANAAPTSNRTTPFTPRRSAFTMVPSRHRKRNTTPSRSSGRPFKKRRRLASSNGTEKSTQKCRATPRSTTTSTPRRRTTPKSTTTPSPKTRVTPKSTTVSTSEPCSTPESMPTPTSKLVETPKSTTTPTQIFNAKDRVMAQWIDDEWYPATILRATTYKNGNTRYRLHFDDGVKRTLVHQKVGN